MFFSVFLFPERYKISIVEQATRECDERIRRRVFISFTSLRASPRLRPQRLIHTDFIPAWPVSLNHRRRRTHDVLERLQFLKVKLTCNSPVYSFREFEEQQLIFSDSQKCNQRGFFFPSGDIELH